MEGMGVKFTPVIVRCILGIPSKFGLIAGNSCTHSYSLNNPNRGFNTPPAASYTAHLTPSYPPTPLYMSFMILQWL